jgi:acetyl esterase/lipase
MTRPPTAFDPAGTAPVEQTDLVYARPGGADLQARLYGAAPAGQARPVVVDLHGGAWAALDRTVGAHYCRALAACGALVVAPDFRDGRNGRHPVAVVDALTAIRWVRANAAALGADLKRVAIVGSSSGGHLALAAALRPDEPAALNVEVEVLEGGTLPAASVDASVCWAGAFWAPVDPLARYRYARSRIGWTVPEGNRLDAAGLVRCSEAYFGDEATMAEASIARRVRDGETAALPPVWLVRAGADLNVPPELLVELADAYAAAGGSVELSDYPGEIHGFGHGDTTGAAAFLGDLRARLAAVFATAG